MPEGSLIFEIGEFRRRVRAIQIRMEEQGIAALFLTSAADIFYVSGFLTRFWESPARPWFVVVPSSGDPIAVIPAIGQALMKRTWVKDIRTWDAPDPVDDGVSLLAETLREVVPENGLMGLPKGMETRLRMPVGDFERLAGAVGTRRFVDATEIAQRVREVKSEDEIAKIRDICAIAGAAFENVPNIVAMNPAIDAIFRNFQADLLTSGADWVSYVAGGAEQGGYGDIISPAASRSVKTGDILMLDTGAVRDGYFCDFDRNFAIGTPCDPVRRAHGALYTATELALRTLRPGMLARDAHQMMADSLSANGMTVCGGRLGHGLGVTLTEWPSFTPKDRTRLRTNMVLTLEPSVEVGNGKILVHEENIVLRDNGPELLSPRAPAELPVIDI